MIKVDLDTRDFDRTLKKYLAHNKRDTGMIIERTGRKLGWEFQKAFKAIKASRSDINQGTAKKRVLVAGDNSVIYLSTRRKKRGKGYTLTEKGKSQLRAIRNKRAKGIAYLSANFLFTGWKVGTRGSNRTINSKVGKQSRVIIRTTRANPYLEFTTDTDGVTKVGRRRGIFARGLTAVQRDMTTYIQRKLQSTADKYYKN